MQKSLRWHESARELGETVQPWHPELGVCSVFLVVRRLVRQSAQSRQVGSHCRLLHESLLEVQSLVLVVRPESRQEIYERFA